ncbi:MAG: YihY/virulence factor BrkB family protein [Rikenellaceae bacterium]
MRKKAKKIANFISHGIWSEDDKRNRWIDLIFDEIKVFIITFKNYGQHKIVVRSAALTYYTLISLVPITAMILGLSKGFGLDKNVLAFLKESINSPDVIEMVLQFANSFLANSNIGIFAGISVVVLLWSVFMVFYNIEESFNYIWEIKRSRPIARKLNDYLAFIILLPILYTISSSVKVFIEGEIARMISDSVFLIYIYKTLLTFFYLITVWLIFAMIYTLLPNTKVKFWGAFHAGVIAGSGYIGFKYLYLFFQSSVTSYNVIYGSFAALPLLLIWLNICWQIILFGGELSYAYQNMARYEYERAAASFSQNLRRKLMVLVVRVIAKNFIETSKPLSANEIADITNMPVAAVRDILYALGKANIIYTLENSTISQKTAYYTMGVDVSTLTVGELINRVDNYGTSKIDDVKNFDIVEDLTIKRDVLIKDL